MTADILSDRLKMVAGMVTPGLALYDVGCDHGFLDIYLVKQGVAPYAVAADINAGPLNSARQNIASAGFEDKICSVLSDGLSAIGTPDAPSALVMAGMGGPLIIDMIGRDIVKARCFEEIIISPQSRIDYVRSMIRKLGFAISDEACIYDQNKFYVAMKLIYAKETYDGYTDTEKRLIRTLGDRGETIIDKYGAGLLAGCDPALIRYLEWEEEILNRNARQIKISGNAQQYETCLLDIADNMAAHKLMEG